MPAAQPLRTAFQRLFLLLLLLLSPLLGAQQQPAPDTAQVLELYVREGCPHCAQAKKYLPALKAAHPEMHIRIFEVDRDPVAREQLMRYSAAAGIQPPGVPSFRFRGRMLVGFDTPQSSGPALERFLAAEEADALAVETALFGTLSVERLGLLTFTLALGLLDGFNPCAMWVLLFLLSLLVHLHDRRRMAVIAGTFVLVSGLVYYAFMAAWLNLFLVVGLTASLRILLGAGALLIGAINIKDFIRPGKGLSLSIPDSVKPGLYARMRRVLATDTLLLSLGGVAILAIVVNFIELLCTAGIPAVYTAVLAQQGVESPAFYGYLALYIVAYMLDDSLMVATAVIAMSSRKLSLHAGRWLKLLSGLVMAALGLLLLLRPQWLM
jgi:glutaredoxin